MNRRKLAKQAREDYFAGRYGPTPAVMWDGIVAALADAIKRLPYYCVMDISNAFLDELAVWHAAVLHRIDSFEVGDVSTPACRLPPNAIHNYEDTIRRISEASS